MGLETQPVGLSVALVVLRAGSIKLGSAFLDTIVSIGMAESIENKSLDKNDIQHKFLYLCVHRFVRVPVSMVYSCYKGKPKMWNVYPANKEHELRSKSCKMCIIFFTLATQYFFQG